MAAFLAHAEHLVENERKKDEKTQEKGDQIPLANGHADKKRWYDPFPKFRLTERPDVAAGLLLVHLPDQAV